MGDRVEVRRGKVSVFWAIAPYWFFLIAFVGYPILSNVVTSLTGPSGLSMSTYRSVLGDPLLPTVATNTVIWTIGSVVLQLVLGLAAALTLNVKFPGQPLARALVLVVPWAVPDIVAAVAWTWMYNDMYGVFNDILVRLGIIGDYLPWLADPTLAKAAVIIANVWKGFPLSGMFYLAALQTVPTELYEAASVDGATGIGQFVHVTLPCIRPYIGTTVLLTIIWTINYFPLIYTMTGGGPAHATETFVTWAYRTGFRFLDFRRSAAISTLTFFFVLVVALAYSAGLLRKGEPESR